MPPSPVTIDSAKKTEFFVESETPVSVTYRFWLQRNGAWTSIPATTAGPSTQPWQVDPPTPSGSILAYWLGIAGKANAPWKVRLTIAQLAADGRWINVASWTESGTTSDLGNGFGIDSTEVMQLRFA